MSVLGQIKPQHGKSPRSNLNGQRRRMALPRSYNNPSFQPTRPSSSLLNFILHNFSSAYFFLSAIFQLKILFFGKLYFSNRLEAFTCSLLYFAVSTSSAGLEQGASAKISPPTKKRHGGHSSLKSSIHPNLYQQYSQLSHKTDNFAGLRVEHENGWGPHETLVGFGHSVIFGSFTICGSFTAPEGHSEEWHHADRRQYGLRGNMAIQMLGP